MPRISSNTCIRSILPLLIFFVLFFSARGAESAIIIGLVNNTELAAIDSDNPNQDISSAPITGVLAGDAMVAIDFRPATGELYGLGFNSGAFSGQLYKIDLASAVATAVGSTFILTGELFGFDFNPVVDRIRVVSDTGLNFRLNPDTGAVAGSDAPLSPSGIFAEAYSNNFPGATVTTLFGITGGVAQLVIQGGIDGMPSPNGGILTTIGPLGPDFSVPSGQFGAFDIASDGTGYASFPLAVSLEPTLFRVDINAVTATAIAGRGFIGLSVLPVPGEFKFSTDNFSVDEGGIATITVLRTEGAVGPVTVDFATSDGTATAGTDYIATSGTLSFASGETSKTFEVTTRNDFSSDNNETVNLTLSNPTGGADLGNPSAAVLTIIENNSPPGGGCNLSPSFSVPTRGAALWIALGLMSALILRRSKASITPS